MQANPGCQRDLNLLVTNYVVIIVALVRRVLNSSLTCCVILGKSLELSEPHFLHPGRIVSFTQEVRLIIPSVSVAWRWNELSVFPVAGESEDSGSICPTGPLPKARASLVIRQQKWISRPQRVENELSALPGMISETKRWGHWDQISPMRSQQNGCFGGFRKPTLNGGTLSAPRLRKSCPRLTISVCCFVPSE